MWSTAALPSPCSRYILRFAFAGVGITEVQHTALYLYEKLNNWRVNSPCQQMQYYKAVHVALICMVQGTWLQRLNLFIIFCWRGHSSSVVPLCSQTHTVTILSKPQGRTQATTPAKQEVHSLGRVLTFVIRQWQARLWRHQDQISDTFWTFYQIRLIVIE